MISELVNKYKTITTILLFLIIYQIIILVANLLFATYKYFIIQEQDLLNRYGDNSWVVITGGSSGQGADLALEFAKRNFNILLIGSKRTDNTRNLINKLYPNIKVNVIYKDFSKAYQENFFNDIEEEFKNIDDNLALLINNVGYRVGWNPYHDMPSHYINDSIITGTIVQSRLTQLVIPYFLKRKELNKKSGLVNITAQCMHPNYLLGIGINNEISVPYLSVYEGANAFGFYQGNSIYKEYKDDFDILNITPGAVVTGNTKYLQTTIFSIDSKTFARNIIKLIGNINGHSCAYWGHAFSEVVINLFPFMKNIILKKVGLTIANEFMEKENINKNKYKL